MKPKRRSYIRRVTALVDADATYLSVVNQGASGSPFNSVKQEEPRNMKVKSRRGVPAPTKSAKNASKRVSANTKKKTSDDASMAPSDKALEKLAFDKSIYETAEEVQQYMDDESDFEGNIEITEDEEFFYVKNADLDPATIKKSAEIPTGEDGISAWVALLKSDTDESDEDDEDEDEDDGAITKSEDDADEDEDGDDEDDDSITKADDTDEDEDEDEEEDEDDKGKKKPVSKREEFLNSLKEEDEKENQKKFDHWNVYEAGDSDFATLLKEGMEDGAAPGFDDVMWTFGQAIRKALKSGGDDMAAGLQKSANDFVNVTIKMNELFSNMVESEKSEIEAELGDETEAFVKWAKGFGLALINEQSRDAAPTKKSKAEAVEAPAFDAAQIAKAVADVIAPLVAANKELSAKMAEVSETVDILGKRRQVSKAISTPDASVSEGSAPTDDTATKKKKTDAGKLSADRIAKVAFGG